MLFADDSALFWIVYPWFHIHYNCYIPKIYIYIYIYKCSWLIITDICTRRKRLWAFFLNNCFFNNDYFLVVWTNWKFITMRSYLLLISYLNNNHSNLWRYYKNTVAWPHGLKATCWWLHLTEFTVVVITRRGKPVIFLHILIDFRQLLFCNHVTSVRRTGVVDTPCEVWSP